MPEGPVVRERPGVRPPRDAPVVVAGHASVDAVLQCSAIVTSGLALLLLAGVPSAAGTAGQVVRGLVLLCFWLIAPGAVVVTRLRLPGLCKPALAPLIGISILIAGGTIGSWTGVWLPQVTVAVVAAAVLIASAIDVWRGRLPLPAVRAPRLLPTVDVLLVLGLGAALTWWGTSIRGLRTAPPSVLGLLAAGPWIFPAAILGTAVVFLVALGARRLTVATAAVLGLIVVLRTTASAVSPVPVWSWTYKHLGLVLALQQHHHVAAGTDVYMNWPGMFAAGAYFSDVSGVAPIDLARWITPLIHVLLALGTAALAQALGARAEGCVAAAGLVVVFNWVGQDYFAPQAVAICLAAGVIVLLVLSSTRRACAVLALWLFSVIVVTHQLTPAWLLTLAVVLVVLRRAPWWLAVGMGLVFGTYLLSRLNVAIDYGLFSGFDPLANAASSVPAVAALGREVGGFFAKASALLMWGSTLAVLAHRSVRLGWRRGWRSPEVLVPAAIVFSPFLMLAGQNYGGEATLRVTLYSAIGCAATLGPALAGALHRRAVTVVAAAGWTILALALTSQSSFSLWSVSLMRPEDVQAARWLADQHADAHVIPVVTNWPGRTSVNYERFIGPLATLEPGLDYLLPTPAPRPGEKTLTIPLTAELVTQVAQKNQATTYVVFSASMRAYNAYYGTYTAGSYDATLTGLAASPDWTLARHQDDLWVFQYVGAHG